MPAADVSDLHDVFEAIDRLCETMKASEREPEPRPEPRTELVVRPVEILTAEDWDALSSCETDSEDANAPARPNEASECVASTFVSAEDVSMHRSETWQAAPREERWSDTRTSPPSSDVSGARDSREVWSDCQMSPPPLSDDVTSGISETVALPSQCEPTGDVYYTASSEVSLVSDTEPEKGQDREEGKECVMAGHVAAMRERFESMTRANTPCPDMMRSVSPSLDVLRVTPSPDPLG